VRHRRPFLATSGTRATACLSSPIGTADAEALMLFHQKGFGCLGIINSAGTLADHHRRRPTPSSASEISTSQSRT
jgi:hypothetical protein